MLLATAGPQLVVEQRKYSRVRLNLPVRLRWRTPFGLRTELGETLELSRGGLLIKRDEAFKTGTSLWLTVPFDPDMRLSQPEIPARVVRVNSRPFGGYLVALAFEIFPPRPTSLPGRRDRRKSVRTRLALPIRVQLEGFPWAEETMTVDVSGGGALFGSSCVYQVGDSARVELEHIPWPGRKNREMLVAKVVRVVEMPNTSEQLVAIQLQSEGAPSS